MANSNVTFDKFCHEANEYLTQLAEELGHPEEKKRVLILWKAVMHTVRDRIHIGESFDLISSLPMIFKGIYVEGWKHHESPPLKYESIEEMKNEVKARQEQFGEQEFDWQKSTEKLIDITLHSLNRYLSNEQMEHIKGQMPKEVKVLI